MLNKDHVKILSKLSCLDDLLGYICIGYKCELWVYFVYLLPLPNTISNVSLSSTLSEDFVLEMQNRLGPCICYPHFRAQPSGTKAQ